MTLLALSPVVKPATVYNMAIFNQALVDGAQVVARVVEYQVREAVSTSVASAFSSPGQATPVPSPTSAMSSISTPSTSLAPTSTVASGQSNNPSGGDKKDGGTGSNSPLLFFVALGFGVVFTNLW